MEAPPLGDPSLSFRWGRSSCNYEGDRSEGVLSRRIVYFFELYTELFCERGHLTPRGSLVAGFDHDCVMHILWVHKNVSLLLLSPSARPLPSNLYSGKNNSIIIEGGGQWQECAGVSCKHKYIRLPCTCPRPSSLLFTRSLCNIYYTWLAAISRSIEFPLRIAPGLRYFRRFLFVSFVLLHPSFS